MAIELLRASEAARRLDVPTKALLELVRQRRIRYETDNGIAHIPADALVECQSKVSQASRSSVPWGPAVGCPPPALRVHASCACRSGNVGRMGGECLASNIALTPCAVPLGRDQTANHRMSGTYKGAQWGWSARWLTDPVGSLWTIPS